MTVKYKHHLNPRMSADLINGTGGTKDVGILARDFKVGDRIVLYRKTNVVVKVKEMEDGLIFIKFDTGKKVKWDADRRFLIRRPLENL